MGSLEVSKSQTSLVVAVENCVALGIELHNLLQHVLCPFIDALSSKYIGDKLPLPAFKKQLYSLLIFESSQNAFENQVYPSKVSTTPTEFKRNLSHLCLKRDSNDDLSCLGFGDVLKRCKQLFRKMQRTRRNNEHSVNHLLLVMNSCSLDDFEENGKSLEQSMKDLKEQLSLSVSLLVLAADVAAAALPDLLPGASKNYISLSDKHSQTCVLFLDGLSLPIATKSKSTNEPSKKPLVNNGVEAQHEDEPAPKKLAVATNGTNVVSQVPVTSTVATPANVSTSQNSSEITANGQRNRVAEMQQQAALSTNSVANSNNPQSTPVCVSTQPQMVPKYNQNMYSTAGNDQMNVSSMPTVSTTSGQSVFAQSSVSRVSYPNSAIAAQPQRSVVWTGLLKVKFPDKSLRAYYVNFLVDSTANIKSRRPPDIEHWPQEGQVQFLTQQEYLKELAEFIKDSIYLPCQFFTRSAGDEMRQEPVAENDPMLQTLNPSSREKIIAFLSLQSPGSGKVMGMIYGCKSQPNASYAAMAIIPSQQDSFQGRLRYVVSQVQQQQQQQMRAANMQNYQAQNQAPKGQAPMVINSQQQQNPGMMQNNPADQPLNQLANLANNTGGMMHPNQSVVNSMVSNSGVIPGKHVQLISSAQMSGNPQVAMQNMQGSMQNVHQNAMQSSMQGVPQGSMQGVPQGSLQGGMQGSMQGVPQGSMQGVQQGSMQGVTVGSMQSVQQGGIKSVQPTMQGVPQGSMQVISQGPMQGQNTNITQLKMGPGMVGGNKMGGQMYVSNQHLPQHGGQMGSHSIQQQQGMHMGGVHHRAMAIQQQSMGSGGVNYMSGTGGGSYIQNQGSSGQPQQQMFTQPGSQQQQQMVAMQQQQMQQMQASKAAGMGGQMWSQQQQQQMYGRPDQPPQSQQTDQSHLYNSDFN